MALTLGSFGIAIVVASLTLALLIPRLRRAGITGRDLHKPGQPELPEMGGLGIVAGFCAGVLLALGEVSFLHLFPKVDMVILLAGLSTVLLTGLIGLVDDLIGLRQWVKTLLPVIAALPLMAVRAGHTWMKVPFLGQVDFWIFYPLVLVPLGITGAANAVNMLAGFNGLEVGMGLVALGSLAVIAATLGETTALILLLSGAGALLGVIYFNWYPARVFIGDVGTLSIGALIATGVIVGNFETAGLIVITPYALDFLIKAAHGLPTSGWWGELRQGRLHCPEGGPVGLGQLIMKLTGGIHERTLVLVLIGVEGLFGLGAVLLYARF